MGFVSQPNLRIEEMSMDKNAQIFLDLGLEIITPFSLYLDSGDIVAPFLLKNFGATEGIIVVYNFDDIKPHLECLKEIKSNGKLCYGFSTLTEPDENFGVDLISTIEMLKDWGWTGSLENKPSFLD